MPSLFVYLLFSGSNSDNCKERKKLKYRSATTLMLMYLGASHSRHGFSIGRVGVATPGTHPY